MSIPGTKGTDAQHRCGTSELGPRKETCDPEQNRECYGQPRLRLPGIDFIEHIGNVS
ncbi:hypothetical protein X736_25450 [Mesorhizobium sp. L2C089B000]|nr:hypothetical protein X736_25450 [Mesorhizobium sp. L2C089B000]